MIFFLVTDSGAATHFPPHMHWRWCLHYQANQSKEEGKNQDTYFDAASAQMSCPSPQNALWIVFVLSGETEQRGRGLGKRATRDAVVGETPWQDAR